MLLSAHEGHEYSLIFLLSHADLANLTKGQGAKRLAGRLRPSVFFIARRERRGRRKTLVALALPPEEELLNMNDHKWPANFREYFYHLTQRARKAQRMLVALAWPPDEELFNTNYHEPLGRWPRAVAISREKQLPVNFRECFLSTDGTDANEL